MKIQSSRIFLWSIVCLFVFVARPASPALAAGNLSYFEKYVEENGGKIPYPFTDLLLSLAEKYDYSTVDLMEFPYGRSPERTKTDLVEPRRIAAFDRASNRVQADRPSKFFLGFAPRDEKVQVLSLVPDTGEYKRMVIVDYAEGKSPKISAAGLGSPDDSATCPTCHQNEGPIFPRFPWSETNNVSTVSHKISVARKAAGLPPSIPELSVPAAEAAKFDASIRISPDGAFAFDGDVRRANKHLQISRMCRSICGNNLACRRQLLALSLASINAAGTQSISLQTRTQLDQSLAYQVSTRWPADDFAYPSSVLPDRNPFVREKEGGVSTFFMAITKDQAMGVAGGPSGGLSDDQKKKLLDFTDGNLTYDEGNSTTDFFNTDLAASGLRDFQVIGSEGKSLANPATSRPKVSPLDRTKLASELLKFGDSCVLLSDEAIDEVGEVDSQRILNLVLHDPGIESVIKTWPPRQDQLLATLRAGLDRQFRQENPSIDCHPTQTAVTPQAKKGIVDSALVARALDHFQKLCVGSCHKGGKDSDIPGLRDDLDFLKRYADSDGFSVIDHLLGKAPIMPPKSADPKRYPKPSNEERAEMIKALQ